jgi:transcriptional regulator with XRE-family HTH domain
MEMQINKATIKALRLEKSWSQEKLADAAGMNLRTIQRIEKDGIASLRSCASLAIALGVEPQQLQIGAEAEARSSLRSLSRRQLNPAASILAAVLMFWGTAQMAAPVYELSVYQSSVISFVFLFFAGFILLAFFTPIASKRLYILAGCVLLAMFVSPPNLLAQLKMTLPLVLLFEFSVLLARRFRVSDDSFPDGV